MPTSTVWRTYGGRSRHSDFLTAIALVMIASFNSFSLFGFGRHLGQVTNFDFCLSLAFASSKYFALNKKKLVPNVFPLSKNKNCENKSMEFCRTGVPDRIYR